MLPSRVKNEGSSDIYNTDRDARFLEDAILSIDRVLQNIIDVPQNYTYAIKRIITYCDMISFELDSLSDLLMQIQKYEDGLPEEAKNICSSPAPSFSCEL